LHRWIGYTYMSAVISRVHQFLVGEDGPAAVEYALMLALIITVCVSVIQVLGASTLGSYGAFGAAMSAVGGNGF
jgi:pilus assembly protein Flp/PilA